MRFNELITNRLCEGLFEWYRRHKISLFDCRVVNRVCTELLDAYRTDSKSFSTQSGNQIEALTHDIPKSKWKSDANFL